LKAKFRKLLEQFKAITPTGDDVRSRSSFMSIGTVGTSLSQQQPMVRTTSYGSSPTMYGHSGHAHVASYSASPGLMPTMSAPSTSGARSVHGGYVMHESMTRSPMMMGAAGPVPAVYGGRAASPSVISMSAGPAHGGGGVSYVTHAAPSGMSYGYAGSTGAHSVRSASSGASGGRPVVRHRAATTRPATTRAEAAKTESKPETTGMTDTLWSMVGWGDTPGK
jgi:hypothetical protein